VAQRAFRDGDVGMAGLGIGLFAESEVVTGSFAMPVIFGERVSGGGWIVLCEGRRYGLHARTGEIERGKKLLIRHRDSGGRDERKEEK
jgi:hypothetical protein